MSNGYDTPYALPPYNPTTAMAPPASTASGVSDDSISYPGPPLLSPPFVPAVIVDSNGKTWLYSNGSWSASVGGVPDYYASPGPPIGTPAANNLQNIIVDSNGRQWQYFGGGWN